MITVSRLLKSCASPPVSWPSASIFCARSTSACARRCSVLSKVSSKQPATWPSAPMSGISEVCTRMREPSMRVSS